MGRFEKRPENPRIRGDLSRAAENALWDVVEDLENLQQNILKSLQDDVKRLETEKTRLANDIQRLIEEKEKLQQARQITEQQVLIRQLAEVLAKHISSQLQSSLKTLATQSAEGESSERATLRSAEVNSHAASQINENVGQMLDNLDDSVTIAFSSLQQELKNYQSHLSQQLSRMYDQQQEGEDILAEFINRLKGELDKTREPTSLKVLTGGAPTVLQLNEPYKNNFSEKSSERIISEPISLFPQALPKNENPPLTTQEKTAEPSSFLTPNSSIPESSTQENTTEPMSFLTPDSSAKSLTPESQIQEKTSEPSSFLTPDSSIPESSTQEKNSEPSSFRTPDSSIPESSTQENTTEPMSFLTPDSSTKSSTPESSTQKNTPEPISVLTPDSSEKQSIYSPSLTPKRETTSRRQRPRSSPNWSPVQMGFLLVVLSTVMSSLYNVAVKALFYQGSDFLGNFETQQFISPTLGNIFLILMLRLLVVVPLMLLLAPILHPPVWQELQNLFDSVGRNATPNHAKTKQVLLLSVVSGCFLFLSQVLIYIAIGQVSTGIAIALFFIYPLISGLLAWFLFRERPNLFTAGAISSIFAGELFILASYSNGMNNTSLGIISGIISGMAFAVYVILTRLCATKLHPVSFALINFATMLLLSFICLMIPLPSDWSLAIRSSNLLEVILSAFMLGVLTLCGYLFNNFGIRKLGGPQSAIIGALVPVLTVIFAGLMIQEKLDLVQIMGVLLVTGGAVTIGFEKMRNHLQSSNTKNQMTRNNETKYRG